MPSAPINLFASAVNGDPYSLYITWTKPSIPNGAISYYTVYCVERNSSTTSPPLTSSADIEVEEVDLIEVVPGISLNATVGGLVPFTEYGCFLSANTSIGEGNFSAIIYQTTDEYGKPYVKHNIAIQVVTL